MMMMLCLHFLRGIFSSTFFFFFFFLPYFLWIRPLLVRSCSFFCPVVWWWAWMGCLSFFVFFFIYYHYPPLIRVVRSNKQRVTHQFFQILSERHRSGFCLVLLFSAPTYSCVTLRTNDDDFFFFETNHPANGSFLKKSTEPEPTSAGWRRGRAC